MTPDALYADLQSLRETFRRKMNKSGEAAQKAAAEDDDMAIVSMHSTDSERFRTAFVALNQAIKIVDDYFAKEPA